MVGASRATRWLAGDERRTTGSLVAMPRDGLAETRQILVRSPMRTKGLLIDFR